MQRIATAHGDEDAARASAMGLQLATRAYIYTVEFDPYKAPFCYRVVRYAVGTDVVPRRSGDEGFYLYNTVVFLAARTNVVPLPREPVPAELHEHAREAWAA